MPRATAGTSSGKASRTGKGTTSTATTPSRSLSSRFGLTILFNKPAKPQFLEIVRSLAEAKGIDMDPEELEKQASAFAIRKGGATPRAAEQFTNSLLAK